MIKFIVFLIEKTVGWDLFVRLCFDKIVATKKVKPTWVGSPGHMDLVAKCKQLEQSNEYWHKKYIGKQFKE